MYIIKIKNIIFSLVFCMQDEIKYSILFLMERAKRTSTHVWFHSWPKWKQSYQVARVSQKLSWQLWLHMDTEYWRSKGQRDILGSGRQHFKNLTCDDYLKVIINIYCICIIQEVKLYYMCFITVWNMFIPQLTFFSKDSRKRPMLQNISQTMWIFQTI